MAKKETTHVPAHQLQVVGATFNALKDKLLENETGWSEEDKALFYKTAGGDVLPVGGRRLDIPTTTSLLMGFEEDAETYTYDWKSLESFEPAQGDPLKLWSHLAGVGFFAEVARRDIKGRDISENLDYASVLIALYDVTTYAAIDSAISSGKSVILSIGQHAKFAYLHSKINSGYVFRSILSEDHTYVDYTVSSNNTWSSNTYDIGESNPTQGSNKLFTSGGAFAALANHNSSAVSHGDIRTALSAEASARSDADAALGERIAALDEVYETKADAKAKANAYGILMRENGTNTLQFYRPSLA